MLVLLIFCCLKTFVKISKEQMFENKLNAKNFKIYELLHEATLNIILVAWKTDDHVIDL